METKQQILKATERLPDDASFEDALERLYPLYRSREAFARRTVVS